MKRRLALAAAAIAILTAGATYAATTLTSSAAATNVIQACVKVPNGDLRIVDSPAQCHRDERSMTWNVQGPKGDKGDKGETGATGAAGLSVQPSALATGDSNCPFGGSSFTVGLLLPTFACNGAPGKDGADGANGADGKDGKDGTTFTSIDGLNGLTCTVGGQAGTVVVGSGAGGTITLTCQAAGGGGGGTGGGASCDGTGQPYPNGTTVCNNGTWSLVCNAGFGDADGQLADGCEVNLMTDENNCGAVGVPARLPNAFAACANGQPYITACYVGFVDLDGIASNGCEAEDACPHPNGLGGEYRDCADELGVPGVATKYNEQMARLAAASWSSTVNASVTNCTDGGSAIAAVNGSQTAVWAYSGPHAGYVSVSSTGAFCPGSTDPTWR
jgi:hypothetical protein